MRSPAMVGDLVNRWLVNRDNNKNLTAKVLSELETQQVSTQGIMDWDVVSTTVNKKVSIGLGGHAFL